jgi:hypothetical protein
VTWRAGAVGTLLALGCCPAPAHAQTPMPNRVSVRSQAGPELSLAVAWGDPHGQREENDDLAEVVVGQAAFEVAAGWRTGFGLLASADAQYGAAVLRDCATSCSGSSVRLGLGLEYHFTPAERVDHYVGLGAGYEWLTLDIGGSRLEYRGLEWLNVRFGEEFALGPLGIGPVLSLALGRYTQHEIEVPPVPAIEGSIAEPTFHVWLFLGVRLSYGWP